MKRSAMVVALALGLMAQGGDGKNAERGKQFFGAG